VATEKTVDAARHTAIGPKSLFLAKNNKMLPQIRDTQYIVFANKKPGASPFINSAYLYWFLSSARAWAGHFLVIKSPLTGCRYGPIFSDSHGSSFPKNPF
jgi:hypothetical protein